MNSVLYTHKLTRFLFSVAICLHPQVNWYFPIFYFWIPFSSGTFSCQFWSMWIKWPSSLFWNMFWINFVVWQTFPFSDGFFPCQNFYRFFPASPLFLQQRHLVPVKRFIGQLQELLWILPIKVLDIHFGLQKDSKKIKEVVLHMDRRTPWWLVPRATVPLLQATKQFKRTDVHDRCSLSPFRAIKKHATRYFKNFFAVYLKVAPLGG